MHGAVDVLNILISLLYFASVQTPVSYSKYKSRCRYFAERAISQGSRGKC
ncbi:hypothetical protein PUN4_730028 [Paraburkholderia unamae]|nr:hypothetical protein PUN4_730028 [Paraburkholderia unamae]